MKVRFKSNVIVDGFEFVEGKVYDLPDFVAQGFIYGNLVEEVGKSKPVEIPEPIEAPKPAKKPAKKKGKY